MAAENIGQARPLIVHVITGLGRGGAENTLVNLVSSSTAFHHIVVSLTPPAANSKKIREFGIELHHLGGNRLSVVFTIFALTRLLRSLKPKLVQTWMYHADIVGGLAARFARVPKVLWNVRHSTVSIASVGLLTYCVIGLWAFFARVVPDSVIVSSREAESAHPVLRWSGIKTHLIGNGVDCVKFRPTSRQKTLSTTKQLVIGFAGRDAPQKGIPVLAEALQILADEHAVTFHLRMAGEGINPTNNRIRESFRGISSVELLGAQQEMQTFYQSIDLLVQPYVDGESFPNVVAEAMASGVPVVATDVGAVREIVGETGWVVTPADPAELAGALLNAYAGGRARLRSRGEEARARIDCCFDLNRMIVDYENLYASLTQFLPLERTGI